MHLRLVRTFADLLFSLSVSNMEYACDWGLILLERHRLAFILLIHFISSLEAAKKKNMYSSFVTNILDSLFIKEEKSFLQNFFFSLFSFVMSEKKKSFV